MSYPRYRDGPVFKAQTPGISELDTATSSVASKSSFFNNGTTAAKITCINHIQIYDELAQRSWYMPNMDNPRNLLISRGEYSHYRPDGVPHDDPALVLLESCLADSRADVILRGDDAEYGSDALSFEVSCHCSYLSCDDLPDDQWKVEVRRCFETSLALIQLNLLDIVRPSAGSGVNETLEHQWDGVPP